MRRFSQYCPSDSLTSPHSTVAEHPVLPIRERGVKVVLIRHTMSGYPYILHVLIDVDLILIFHEVIPRNAYVFRISQNH
ncbi:unnamed protein product [Oppiella nova]|uniref:Uncharacterized protein n=1 Tax=Oppiella nova TaxID=334625 RepID=A0A7R9M4K6_9ACAR|nr:unnamed protein product [Oppiella nova]CAG2169335.1 unnamed protein product [Oppiella nova]